MKTKILFAATIVSIALSLLSCDSKQTSISQLEKFNQELYLHSMDYTPEQWANAEKKFEKISANIAKYEDEMTFEEKVYVTKMQTECNVHLGKNKAMELWKDVKNILN